MAGQSQHSEVVAAPPAFPFEKISRNECCSLTNCGRVGQAPARAADGQPDALAGLIRNVDIEQSGPGNVRPQFGRQKKMTPLSPLEVPLCRRREIMTDPVVMAGVQG